MCIRDRLFIWIKKWDSEIFLLQRIAARFSANIIWLLFYLFAESPRLRGVVNAAASRRPLRGCTNFFEASGYAQTKKTYFFESSLPTFFQESRREVFWFLDKKAHVWYTLNCIIIEIYSFAPVSYTHLERADSASEMTALRDTARIYRLSRLYSCSFSA